MTFPQKTLKFLKKQTHTYVIVPTFNGVDVTEMKYSTDDGKNWKDVSCCIIVSTKQLTSFSLCIIDSDENKTYWKYSGKSGEYLKPITD